jgi:hypothetical protein
LNRRGVTTTSLEDMAIAGDHYVLQSGERRGG